MTYYIQFYDRRPGVDIEELRQTAIPSFDEWSLRYPDDELVLHAGRTWRLGPHPYLVIWGCTGMSRMNTWDSIVRSSEADDIEDPLLDLLTTYAAGFYRDVGGSLPRPANGPFYVETFVPWVGAEASYVERSEEAGVVLNLLIGRIGLLAPDPGGIAVLSLGTLADAERLSAAPSQVTSVGLYERAGREIL